jgi:hypothetical protein
MMAGAKGAQGEPDPGHFERFCNVAVHARPPAAVNAGHFSSDADGRPKTGCRRLPLACRPSRYPLGQAGNDPP